MSGHYLSLEEVEKKHGLNQGRIKGLCIRGKVEGAMIVGRTWVVPESWVLWVMEKPTRLFEGGVQESHR